MQKRRAPTFLTADEWTEKISEYRASGMTRSAWCQKNSITISTMIRWEQKLANQPDGHLHFVEIVPSNSRHTEHMYESFPNTKKSSPAFTIEYRDCKIHVDGAFSEQGLERILRVIRHAE